MVYSHKGGSSWGIINNEMQPALLSRDDADSPNVDRLSVTCFFENFGLSGSVRQKKCFGK